MARDVGACFHSTVHRFAVPKAVVCVDLSVSGTSGTPLRQALTEMAGRVAMELLNEESYAPRPHLELHRELTPVLI